MPKYTIDQQGIDGRWRVWWLNPEGYSVERLFDSRESAERWVEAAETIDELPAADVDGGLSGEAH